MAGTSTSSDDKLVMSGSFLNTIYSDLKTTDQYSTS